MASNGERFLAAFNKLDKSLKSDLNIQRHTSFARMVESAKKRHPIVQKYENDLKKFAELRNVIVHEQIAPDYIIAEPHIDLVEKIESIVEKLTMPEKVYPRYKRKVRTFQYYGQLGEVLEVIKHKSFTQFPIYNGGQFMGLLTNNGISAWLAHNQDQCAMSINNVLLNEVFQFEKHCHNVMFVSRDKYVFEIKDLFITNFNRKMTRLDALLITNNGHRHEDLLGIITPFDVIRMD